MKYPLLIALSLITLVSACSTSPKPSDTSDAELTDVLGAVFGVRKQPDMTQLEKHPLGTPENPVRVAMPIGQHDYLSRLICENDERISAFNRIGNAGIGPYGSMVDAYTVICDTNKGAVEYSVYLDMYHSDYEEIRPAQGFKALLPKQK